MVQCPYPETIHDEKSGMAVPNDKYKCWHEGYEAHKFEMANLLITIASLAQRLDDEVKNIKEPKRELKNRRPSFRKGIKRASSSTTINPGFYIDFTMINN